MQILEELTDLNRGGTKDIMVHKKALIFRNNTEKTLFISLKLRISPTGKCYRVPTVYVTGKTDKIYML